MAESADTTAQLAALHAEENAKSFDEVSNSGCVGSVDIFGCDSPSTSSPPHPQCVRCSIGAVASVQIEFVLVQTQSAL